MNLAIALFMMNVAETRQWGVPLFLLKFPVSNTALPELSKGNTTGNLQRSVWRFCSGLCFFLNSFILLLKHVFSLSLTPNELVLACLFIWHLFLHQVCPILDRGENNTYACCSLLQLRSLQTSLSLSNSVLVRCPSCSENFAHLHCINTCSPNQSQVVKVTKVMNVTDTYNRTREAVVGYQSFITTEFANNAFDSCKNVRIPATGGFAISTMCGQYGAKLCNAQRWYDFQGDSSNGLAPLDIDFRLIKEGDTAGVPEGVIPYNGRALKCNETTPSGGEPCSCNDCKDSCPQVSIPQPPGPFKLLGEDGYLVISIILFCLLICSFLLFIFVSCWVRSKKRKDEKTGKKKAKGKDQNSNDVTQQVIDPSEVTCADRNSLAAQAFLSTLFQEWGTLMAKYPFTVSISKHFFTRKCRAHNMHVYCFS